MKVAIPVLNGRVAPVFDWATKLIVIELDRMKELRRQQMSIARVPAEARPQRLRELGVDLLICGGISTQLQGLVESHQIRVLPWLVGDFEQVLLGFTGRHSPPVGPAESGETERAQNVEPQPPKEPRRTRCRTKK